MSLWARVRGWRWYWKLALAAGAFPIVAVLLYVVGRSALYLAAEKDAGLYVPAGAQAVVRVRDLAAHLDRIDGTYAWRTLRKKILGDAAVRPALNAALADAGLPTLDDLEDERKATLYSKENLLRGAGRDAVACLRMGDGPKSTRFCAATRLRWSDYLLAPLARLVLASQRAGDHTLLRAGKGLWIAFDGALVLASNDPGLLEEALRGKGRPPPGERPIEGRIAFEGSRALIEMRSAVRRLNLLPHVKADTIRAVRFSADVEEGLLRFDSVLEGAERVHAAAVPPRVLERWAPGTATGHLSLGASIQDLYGWLSRNAAADVNFRQALEFLERGGFSTLLLPRLDPGLAVLTGTQEQEGRLFPAFVLYMPTTDPAGAAGALKEVVLKIGGKMGENQFRPRPVADTTLMVLQLPGAVGPYADFLQPVWAGVKDGLLFGNNEAFVEAVIHAAASGQEPWRERKGYRRLQQRLKDLGFAAAPPLAGGVLMPPALKASLDGVFERLAVTFAVTDGPTLRREIDEELRLQNRQLPEAEVVQLFNERRRQKELEFEEQLRRSLRVLDAVRWCAFESAPAADGITLRVVVGFDALN
ncbi:MAG TPA: hypothetical protein VEJ18_11670 [Planctomycetota bacterium]|nr:hypothetical protein [Planctomycetota bacterium]